MPKSFRELSSRQKNRRLQAYEKHEHQPILHRVNRPIISIGVASLESLADVNVPIRQCTSPDNSNLNNALNIYSTEFASSDVHHVIVEEEASSDVHHVIVEEEASSDVHHVIVEEEASSDVHHVIVEKPEDKENIEENINKTLDLSNWLCFWKLKHNITHTALSELLNKLRTCGYYDLSKDARTLLNTPKNSIIEILAENESLFHYGLKKAIIEQLVRTKFIVKNQVIMIDLNIDGLPISKSSKSQIWPILGKIYGDKAFTPFVISAYHGYSKPSSVHKFLTPFCQEYNVLRNRGPSFGEQTKTVKHRRIVVARDTKDHV